MAGFGYHFRQVAEDGVVFLVVDQAGQGDVELDHVNRHGSQITQGRVATAEVIQSDTESHFAQGFKIYPGGLEAG